MLLRDENETVDRSTRYQRAADAGAEVLLSIHHNGSSDPTVNYTSTYYTQQSDKRIATLSQDCLVDHLRFPDEGARRSGFGMTVKPKMPSALTEAWFVTHDGLAQQYLTDPSSLIDLEAQALTNAVKIYFTTNNNACR